MSLFLALNRPREMSARRSLSGVKRTRLGRRLRSQSDLKKTCHSRSASAKYSPLQLLGRFDCPVVHETEGNRPTGYGAAHAVAEMQRRAARKRSIHRIAIDIAHLGWGIVA